jgi:predicted TIM-barrel fold metal-dependent hydrolase
MFRRRLTNMTDIHVHIGQFKEIYYTAEEVFDAVFAGGSIDRFVFSSTTSCVEGVLYDTVVAEIEAALKLYGPEKTAPLFWFNPAYLEQGINIEQIMDDLPYQGFKLHPLINNWDFENPDHIKALRKAFDYAAQNELPVLIHTGEGDVHSPDRFQAFFGLYPTVQFILAHSRPAETTITMLQKYSNVYCDSSFAPEESLQKITVAGFASRILFGTDFPITHYFRTKYPPQASVPVITLQEQYREDMAQSMRFAAAEIVLELFLRRK